MAGMLEGLQYRVLGPIEAIVDGEPVALAPKQRKLLALFLIHADTVVSVDRIIDVLWGERPPHGVSDAVRFHVSRLRRALRAGHEPAAGADLITRERDGYRLVGGQHQIDACRFEQLVRRASEKAGSDATEAVQIIDAALDLWRGNPYADVTYEDFAQLEIRRFEAARLQAIELRINLLLHLERHEEAIGALESLVIEFPIHEGLAELLLSTLNRVGRPTDALAAYSGVEDRFRTELGIRPTEALRRLEVESRLATEDPLWAGPGQARHNIPRSLTTYIERGGETEAVRDRVRSRRLVTLLGPGGIGKTRMATEAAAELLPEYRSGIWFVDLAPVVSDEGVVRAISRATNTPESTDEPVDELVTHLSQLDLLLIVDNCEHVVQACAVLIERLLGECPLLRVLATSREPLGVSGECIFQVEPLDIPVGDVDLASAHSAPSLRLFIDRASDASQFELTELNLDAVVALMRRLAGLPLAIEMAAARTRDVEPAEITKRLNSHLDYLQSRGRGVPDRHRSLAATFQWSYDLLDAEQQGTFRALAVFEGEFTLDAAAAVRDLDPTPTLADDVGELVDASLLRRSGDRYRMLEPVREFSEGLLIEHAEDHVARDRHLRYYEALAYRQRVAEGRVADDPSGAEDRGDRMEIVERVAQDLDNYRAAFRHASENGDRRAAIEIAAGTSQHLIARLAIRESARLLAAALDIEGDAPDGLLADAHMNLAWIRADLGDLAGSEELALVALEISRRMASEEDESDALFTLANAAFESGDLTLARDRLTACIDACVTVEPSRTSRQSLALVEALLGNLTVAAEMLDELETAPLDQQMTAYVPRTRGMIAASLGDHGAALKCFERGAEASPTDRATLEGLRHVAYAHLNLGDHERARRLGEYVHERSLETGIPTYIERTGSLLGLIEIRQGRPGIGIGLVGEGLASAVSRGDRYRAWSFLYAASEALLAVGHPDEALGLLRLAETTADEHGYWLPAMDWVPRIDRESIETVAARSVPDVKDFESAVRTTRAAMKRW
ncbi:MAG: BTAD domain-containing putative transcriptional regulator [Actinomycetota bacterium]